MPTNATRLSDRQLKAVKATGKDFVLSDGDGLQLRVRASGSMMWNFNYREPLTRSRINMALGPYPDLSLPGCITYKIGSTHAVQINSLCIYRIQITGSC